MVPSFLVMLREGLEAALIVGIIAAYLVKVGRKDALKGVWIGVAAAVILSLAVAGIASATIGELPFVVQEAIGGIASLAAVVVLTWMLFWMRRQGRGLKSELERGVDGALVGGSMVALAALAFVSVAREGLETVLFMSVVFSAAAPGPEPAIGAVLGLAVAVGIGVAIFWGGVRVDLRRFFFVTSIVLMFVAAGLCAYAVHEFGEAGLIANSGTLFDVSAVLPETSPLGSVLSGMFGFRPDPTPLEVAAYFGYLIPVLTAVHRDRPHPARDPSGGRLARSLLGDAREEFRSLHRTHLPNCTLVRQIRARSALPVGRLGSVGLAAPSPSRDRPDTDETVVGGGSTCLRRRGALRRED